MVVGLFFFMQQRRENLREKVLSVLFTLNFKNRLGLLTLLNPIELKTLFTQF